MRVRPVVPIAALWLVLLAAPGHGVETVLPPSLAGRAEVQVLSCDRHDGGADLRVARVRVTVGAAEIELDDLQCGAFEPGTDRALLLNAVDGLGRLAAGSDRIAEVVFPASHLYTECRCVVGGATALRETTGRWGAWWAAEAWEPTERPEALDWRGGTDPVGPAGLRRELVLRPATRIHDRPGEDEPVVGRVPAGRQVEVFAVQGGWKRVRSDDGVEGWIRSDASTADLEAPKRVGAYLDELAGKLRPSNGPPRRLSEACPVSAAEALPQLVFSLLPDLHTVYVTNLWYTLDESQRDAFHAWVEGCHDVRRIVEMATGAELRGEAWGDRPSLPPASL